MVVEMALSTQPPTRVPVSLPILTHSLPIFPPPLLFITNLFAISSFTPPWISILFSFCHPAFSPSNSSVCPPRPRFPQFSSNLPFCTLFYPICEHIKLLLGAMVWQDSGRIKKESMPSWTLYRIALLGHTALIDKGGTAVNSQSDYHLLVLLFLTSSVKLPQTASRQTTPQIACNKLWHHTRCKDASLANSSGNMEYEYEIHRSEMLWWVTYSVLNPILVFILVKWHTWK